MKGTIERGTGQEVKWGNGKQETKDDSILHWKNHETVNPPGVEAPDQNLE